MLDPLSHLAQPTPNWLASLTPDDIASGPLQWRSEILKGALVYPGAGLDGSPIRQCTGIIRSFVYLDLGTSKADYLSAFAKRRRSGEGFAHHQLVGMAEFDAAPFVGPGLELLHGDGRFLVEDVTPVFGIWAVYETTTPGSTERFSVLVLSVEAVSGLLALFPIAPPFALVGQDHAWGTTHWLSLTAAIRQHMPWRVPPKLIIAASENRLAEWIVGARLLGTDLASESQNGGVRQFCEVVVCSEVLDDA